MGWIWKEGRAKPYGEKKARERRRLLALSLSRPKEEENVYIITEVLTSIYYIYTNIIGFANEMFEFFIIFKFLLYFLLFLTKSFFDNALCVLFLIK